jgi:GntR family transcriptional regulator, arabinose operon transcriptional repressor
VEKNLNKPLYRQIVDSLKQKIDNGELLPDEKLPTEVDLADKFNVSRITSKKALEELEKMKLIYRIQGSGSYVSVEVEDTSGEKADNISGIQGSKAIAIVLPFDISYGRLTDCIKGATEVLGKRGYYLTIHSTDRDAEKERVILNNLYQNGIDGIIYYPLSDNRNLDVVHRLYINNYPIVTIDKYFESIPISNVISDNFKGSYEATAYLIGLGHKKIAYISDINIESASSIRNRYFGYVQALMDNNLGMNYEIIKLNLNEVGNRNIKSNNVMVDEKYSEVLKNTIMDLLTKDVTGIIAVNDYVAINIINTCRSMEIKVPEQMSVIGFDNLELTQFMSIPITSVEQNFHEIGKAAVEILISHIELGRNEYVQNIIPTKFIERQSCIEI